MSGFDGAKLSVSSPNTLVFFTEFDGVRSSLLWPRAYLFFLAEFVGVLN